jgi:hypothetical protein
VRAKPPRHSRCALSQPRLRFGKARVAQSAISLEDYVGLLADLTLSTGRRIVLEPRLTRDYCDRRVGPERIKGRLLWRYLGLRRRDVNQALPCVSNIARSMASRGVRPAHSTN